MNYSAYPVLPINSLGLTATHQRTIRPGNFYSHLIPAAIGKEVTEHRNGDTFDTIKLIKHKIHKDAWQADKLAPKLKGANLRETCKNVFDFFYNHFQYKLDPHDREQVKSLRSSWENRKTGIDCDDFATGVGKVLTQLNIPFFIKKIAVKGYSNYHHVYVVVPKTKGASIKKRQNYYVIDPVLNRFDKEAPQIVKEFNLMGKITYLDGLGATKTEREEIADDILELVKYERHHIKNFALNQYQKLFGSNLNKYYNNIDAIEKLANTYKTRKVYQSFWLGNQLALYGVNILRLVNKDEANKLGLTRADVGIVALLKGENIINDLLSKSFQGRVLIKVAKTFKYNPVVAGLRLGLRKGIELNAPYRHDIAAKLYPAIAYKDMNEAAKKGGYSPVQFKLMKSSYDQAHKIFVGMGGEKKNLDESIEKGYKRLVEKGRVKVFDPASRKFTRANPNSTPTSQTSSKPNQNPTGVNIIKNQYAAMSQNIGSLGAADIAAITALIVAAGTLIASIDALANTIKGDPELSENDVLTWSDIDNNDDGLLDDEGSGGSGGSGGSNTKLMAGGLVLGLLALVTMSSDDSKPTGKKLSGQVGDPKPKKTTKPRSVNTPVVFDI